MIAFITSKGNFDKQDSALREYVAARADLLGPIRLPNDTFKRNANTEVTTDIVFLRKRLPEEIPDGPPWRELHTITNSASKSLQVNEYDAARPRMMLGEMRLVGRRYGQHEPTLIPTAGDLRDSLAKVIQLLPSGAYPTGGNGSANGTVFRRSWR